MQCPEAMVKPIYTNEVDGVNMLLKNKVMLTITARNFTKKEYDYLKGTDQLPEAVPLAYDGMVSSAIIRTLTLASQSMI